jgi:16S rRNA (adenine1518-N6/adenine1519-N6)-dimethyltransferase
VKAKKHLGQNFLQDASVVRRIVQALEIKPSDTVLEIGPGMGALTGELLQHAENVVAIEFDRDMVGHLRRRFADAKKLTILQADALTVDLSGVIPDSDVKLAANLPYYISTPILQRLAAERERFAVIVLMFQKEVVDRILARPGTSDRGFLTLLVENAFSAERLFDVPPEAFSPQPKVTSSVVRLVPRTSAVAPDLLEPLLSIAFRQKRKTIGNNLKGNVEGHTLALERARIDPGRRAETLTLDEWKALTDAISAKQ